MKTIILDAGAAARLLHKHNNAPRLTPTRCTECGRVFDLANETDAAEWAFGHDCETQPTIEVRWCDQGCGYKLPDEYKLDETTCGACLNEQEFVKQIEAKILEHRRHAFDPETGEYHKAEIVRLKEHPMLKAAYNQRQEALSQKSSEALLRRWQ